jgi:hypothetical protein
MPAGTIFRELNEGVDYGAILSQELETLLQKEAHILGVLATIGCQKEIAWVYIDELSDDQVTRIEAESPLIDLINAAG